MTITTTTEARHTVDTMRTLGAQLRPGLSRGELDVIAYNALTGAQRLARLVGDEAIEDQHGGSLQYLADTTTLVLDPDEAHAQATAAWSFRDNGELFEETDQGEPKCQRCGGIDTFVTADWPSYGGTTEGFEVCSRCGASASWIDMTAVL